MFIYKNISVKYIKISDSVNQWRCVFIHINEGEYIVLEDGLLKHAYNSKILHNIINFKIPSYYEN